MLRYIYTYIFNCKSFPYLRYGIEYIPGVAELTVGAQLSNKKHFHCEKLNSYEHLQILWGKCPQCPPGSAAYGTYAYQAIHMQC